MNNMNGIENLRKYILAKYGGFAKFSKKEHFSTQYLETILNKKDILYEIGVGLKVARALNIDAEKLFCYCEIVPLKSENPEDSEEEQIKPIDDIIKEKYFTLTEEERKKALDYAEFIFETGSG